MLDESRKNQDLESAHEQVSRLLSVVDEIVATEGQRESDGLSDTSPVVKRYAIAEARVEVALLRGALRELTSLMQASIKSPDEATFYACADVLQPLQDAFELAEATLRAHEGSEGDRRAADPSPSGAER